MSNQKQKSVVDGTDVEELRERIKQYYAQVRKMQIFIFG